MRGISQPKRTFEKVSQLEFPSVLNLLTDFQFQTEKTSWLKTREMFMTTHIDLFK